MIVTIDGPAGAGKSSAARRLAERLGFDLLDTGAMYRAVALAGLRAGCDLAAEETMAGLLAGMHLEMHPGRVLLDGEDVAPLLRTPEITAASAPVASNRVVRERLVYWQREFAERRNIVTEGRDQGTIVFPTAECKFFLTADPRERARRRYLEMRDRGVALQLEEVLRSQEERDARDAARTLAPMKPAPDALILDTTTLDLDMVVERMESEVRRRMGSVP